MASNFSNAVPSSADGTRVPEPSYFSLLEQLASSLQESRAAVLSRNLARLEQLTAEQGVLSQLLSPLAQTETRRARASGIPTDREIIAAEARLLHLGRVQQALLQRARRRTRIVSQLLAGADSSYAVTADHRGIELRVFDPKER